jgi:hypothetical protein
MEVEVEVDVDVAVSARIESAATLAEVEVLLSRDSSLGPSNAVFRSEPRRRRVRRCASAADIARLLVLVLALWIALLGPLSIVGMLGWRSMGERKESRASRDAERPRLWLDRRLGEPSDGGRSALLASIGTGSCRQSTSLGERFVSGALRVEVIYTGCIR